jgi:hypothetical protein
MKRFTFWSSLCAWLAPWWRGPKAPVRIVGVERLRIYFRSRLGR